VTPSAGLLELAAYSDHERLKWRAWVEQDPSRLAIPFQHGARFPTTWSVFDHIFLVERRHLARLEGSTPPDTTGCAPGDWQTLFDYADLVRADYRQYVEEMDPTEAAATITFSIPGGAVFPNGATFSMTRRKLALHILVHEVRHLAQVAHAARTAGVAPPGEHDVFFFGDLA
jgi:uncharacterized damage-inducible protein DinB